MISIFFSDNKTHNYDETEIEYISVKNFPNEIIKFFVLFKHLQFSPCFKYSCVPPLTSEDRFESRFCHVRTSPFLVCEWVRTDESPSPVMCGIYY